MSLTCCPRMWYRAHWLSDRLFSPPGGIGPAAPPLYSGVGIVLNNRRQPAMVCAFAFVQSPLPRSHQGVKLPRFDVDTRKGVASKIQAMIGKSYLEVVCILTSLHNFAVP